MPWPFQSGKIAAHVLGAGLLAEHDVRAVADRGLLPLDRDAILGLHLRNGCDVADRVIAEAGRVRLEELDRHPDDLRHRRREVEVADDAAGDPRRARADVVLLEHDDVLTGAAARGLELEREVIRARQAVNPAADDEVA